jgi:uncharacterized coiled-coil DUF342 family protein
MLTSLASAWRAHEQELERIDAELNQLVNQRNEIYHFQSQNSLQKQQLKQQLAQQQPTAEQRETLNHQLNGLSDRAIELRLKQSNLFNRLQSLLKERVSVTMERSKLTGSAGDSGQKERQSPTIPPSPQPSNLNSNCSGSTAFSSSVMKTRYERFRIQTPNESVQTLLASSNGVPHSNLAAQTTIQQQQQQQPPLFRRRRWLKTCYDTFSGGSAVSTPPRTPPSSPGKRQGSSRSSSSPTTFQSYQQYDNV